MPLPETEYARRGAAHIAYQFFGTGPPDILLVSTWISHLEVRWEIPTMAHWLRRLASFGRLISFDKLGIGLSDPLPPDALPPLEKWAEDISAVMDAAGSKRATVIGVNEGASMAALYAASHPDRVERLVLVQPTPRLEEAPDHPIGLPTAVIEMLLSTVEENWGRIVPLNPSLEGDEAAQRAWARFTRLAASPATAVAMVDMFFHLDIRDILPTISVPTLAIHRTHNPLIPLEHGRYVADQIPGAMFVEIPGLDYGMGIGDVEPALIEIQRFITGAQGPTDVNRRLATVLFTDIVGSTEKAREVGDAAWATLLDRHDDVVRHEVSLHSGTYEGTTGDGLVATFDGPSRALRCAFALRDRLESLGLQIRAGLHTGDIEKASQNIRGVGVHVAARVQALAGPREVFATRTVKRPVHRVRLALRRGGHPPPQGRAGRNGRSTS